MIEKKSKKNKQPILIAFLRKPKELTSFEIFRKQIEYDSLKRMIDESNAEANKRRR